eukprot:scaffold37730_cov28-Tisochrysis_lutea.AAC.4
MDDRHCAELMKPPWRISCAWSSWDFGRAKNSGTGCKNKFELRRLWYSRHHYMSRVIGERGGGHSLIEVGKATLVGTEELLRPHSKHALSSVRGRGETDLGVRMIPRHEITTSVVLHR